MPFLQTVILFMINRINGQRTASSVFHLLKGKKSSQTIQDAKLYQLDQWFQTVPFLQRSMFDQLIEELTGRRLIEPSGDQFVRVTSEGKELADQFTETVQSFTCLNGWKLQDCANAFWKRLSLTVQVASHLIYQDASYLPVTKDESVQRWLKAFLSNSRLSRENLAEQLHEELFLLLKEAPPENPLLLVLRLTGKKRTGKTIEQAGELTGLESTEYWFRFLHLLHWLIEQVMVRKADCPLLFAMVSDIYEPVTLTQSTKKTKDMLEKGWTIEDIMSNRRLKRSTIEDHIVELALNVPDFSIRPFVSEETENQVLQARAAFPGTRMKTIKEQLPAVSYFQIRLVLAKFNE
ncbi:helix-turn-helix domain-containing protein [Bacillus thermotolerans]|uniref:helix-turn-helix domain-containing protein n=1 Tax=Bacillus thermotolerans TaxID=1221996 RepID=UPI0005894560|nr:helix-turn-helix domain-containing protein [Bacillus thermotolerans]KKB37981.1 hypothetical protein QY96_03141 [Bacillus thermotolerans]